MTSSPPKLSVITFPKESLSSEEGLRLKTKVVSALEDYGCFMAKYDTLSGCHEKLFRALKVIFGLPVETKKHNVSDIQDFAYQKNHPVLRDQYESFGIPKATKEGPQKFITSMWPKGNNAMSNDILAYTRTAAALEEKVRKMVFEHYKVKLPKESPGYIFRVMKYKKEVRLGCSDQEFLAVLDLNKVNGLEMKKDGQWFSIDVKPSTFLIMAGKLLTGWSNRKINPPELLVRVRGNEEKYSVGLFAYYDEKGKDKDPKRPVGSSSRS